MGKQWKQWDTLSLGAPKSLQMMTATMKLKDSFSLKGVMTNLDSILKSRDITLPTKVHLVKAMVFLIVMYGCESWTVKKAECLRIDAFELWCLRRLLESLGLQGEPTSPSFRKSVLNIHWKNWCWTWNSNTLVTWWEELTHWEIPFCWERLKARGKGGNRGWDDWMALLTWWKWVWASSRSWWWESLVCCSPWGCKESDTTKRLNRLVSINYCSVTVLICIIVELE